MEERKFEPTKKNRMRNAEVFEQSLSQLTPLCQSIFDMAYADRGREPYTTEFVSTEVEIKKKTAGRSQGEIHVSFSRIVSEDGRIYPMTVITLQNSQGTYIQLRVGEHRLPNDGIMIHDPINQGFFGVTPEETDPATMQILVSLVSEAKALVEVGRFKLQPGPKDAGPERHALKFR